MNSTTKPIFDFTNYIAERTQHFTGREWVFAEIDAWLATPDAPRYFIITGEPGIGKTALAGRLTQIRSLDATHFCIARQADTIDPLNFARSISHQLTRIDGFAQSLLKEKSVKIEVNINVQENIGQVVGVQIENLMGGAESAAIAFSRVVANPLRQLYADGFDRQILILVDALDEAVRQPGAETIVSLLENARSLPEQVRFLLTARPDADALRHFEELKLPYLQIDAGREENQKDIREYVAQRIAASEILQTRLSEQDMPVQAFVERVATASQGNFLYLIWLLRGITEGTQRFETLNDLPDGLDGIYREFLRTRTVGENRKDWQKMYRPLLGVLAAAQAPLTAEQLAKFSGLSQQGVNDLLLDVRQFLDPIHAEQGQYQLYHQSLPDFFQQQKRAKEFWIDLPPFHQQIAAYYQEQYASHWANCDLYGLHYLPLHLTRAGQHETLWELLFNFEWLQAKLTVTDIYFLLADYDLSLISHEGIEEEDALHLVQSALRLSSHILVHDPAQLPSQLHGRLCSQTTPSIRELLAQARGQSLWLRPMTSILTSPSGALLYTLITGCTNEITAVVVTPDGRQVVSVAGSGFGYGTLGVWDLSSGKKMRTLTVHTDGGKDFWDLIGHSVQVTAVAVTPDGRQVVSASYNDSLDGTLNVLKVWDLANGGELHTFGEELHTFGEELQLTNQVTAVAVTPDGRQMVSAYRDKTLKVWDLVSGKAQRTLTGHTDRVTAVALTPDGRQVVVSKRYKLPPALMVWDLASGEEQRTLVGHTGEIHAVAVTPDGRQVVSASRDQTLKVWDLNTSKMRTTFTADAELWCCAVAPDGATIVAGDSLGYVYFLRVEQGELQGLDINKD